MATKNSQDVFLPESSRALIVYFLAENGVIDADKLSDQELVSKQADLIKAQQVEFAKSKKEKDKTKEQSLEVALKVYAEASNLTDMEFIKRLYLMSVSDTYIGMFRNEDNVLTDGQIWERIRYSGIRPLDPQEMFRLRDKLKITPRQKMQQAMRSLRRSEEGGGEWI
jgi:hypothetical protein